MTTATLTATTFTPLGFTPTVPTPVFDRYLTDDELDCVVAQVLATDYEHGIVAALAVFDVVAGDGRRTDHGTSHTLDPAAIPAIPMHQWREIQAVIDREARRHAPGSESAVLADWVDFGPRISAG